MKRLLCIVFSLAVAVASQPQIAPSQDLSQKDIDEVKLARQLASEEDLARMIGRLSRPDTRAQALSELIRFSSPYLYPTGSLNPLGSNTKVDVLKRRAAEIVHQQADIETVILALDSADPDLQFWGMIKWKGKLEATERNGPDNWLALLPKIKRLAVAGDTGIREFAIGHLRSVEEARDFLAERMDVETSASVLMILVRHGDKGEFSRRFNPLLLRSLNHMDVEVRLQALGAIWANGTAAPGWQVDFDLGIFERVLELTQSSSERERAKAAAALEEVRHLDSDRSREVFICLAADPAEEVRSRVAWGLKGQFQLEDVKPIIQALVRDPSPLVRYMTILAVGPAGYKEELRQLTQSSNQQIAEWAADKLKQLEQDEKKD